jgi:hypothetical protein
VVVYDSGDPVSRYLSSLIDSISTVLEPAMVIAKLDARLLPELLDAIGVSSASPPRLRLYLNGELIWEQIGVFEGNPYADKFAIRRGILMALRKRGLRPRDLGLSLAIY